MPTYGYRCTACGHEFERMQKITEPALTACESCEGPVRKILYPVGIAFKGEGFYVNDYKKSSGGGSKSSESSESKTSSETKSGGDAKPATETKASTPSSDSAS
ncbi:MAG: FmdB family zinc ribbon protein [Armatimonadota bacterium]